MQFLGRSSKMRQRIENQMCKNRSKKELFGIRTKLSYSKHFFRKYISHRNEKIPQILQIYKPVYLELQKRDCSN